MELPSSLLAQVDPNESQIVSEEPVNTTVSTELPETKHFVLDPLYNGPANQPPLEYGRRGNMAERPRKEMPEYLNQPKPEPKHQGKKPKAGFPKWNSKTDPITWFLMIRDTTKRFQEATFSICPSDEEIDTGPKIIDYYVFLWQEFKARYTTMFEDPYYQDKYFCFGSRSYWQPAEDQYPDYPYELLKDRYLTILVSLKTMQCRLDKTKTVEALMNLSFADVEE